MVKDLNRIKIRIKILILQNLSLHNFESPFQSHRVFQISSSVTKIAPWIWQIPPLESLMQSLADSPKPLLISFHHPPVQTCLCPSPSCICVCVCLRFSTIRVGGNRSFPKYNNRTKNNKKSDESSLAQIQHKMWRLLASGSSPTVVYECVSVGIGTILCMFWYRARWG